MWRGRGGREKEFLKSDLSHSPRMGWLRCRRGLEEEEGKGGRKSFGFQERRREGGVNPRGNLMSKEEERRSQSFASSSSSTPPPTYFLCADNGVTDGRRRYDAPFLRYSSRTEVIRSEEVYRMMLYKKMKLPRSHSPQSAILTIKGGGGS